MKLISINAFNPVYTKCDYFTYNQYKMMNDVFPMPYFLLIL